MKRSLQWGSVAAVLVVAAFLCGAATQQCNPVKRVGMVVGIKPEMIAEYKRLHADGNAGVRDLLGKYHIHNFSIFLHQIGGRWYEFGYYEYTDADFDGDMEKLNAEPSNQ